MVVSFHMTVRKIPKCMYHLNVLRTLHAVYVYKYLSKIERANGELLFAFFLIASHIPRYILCFYAANE